MTEQLNIAELRRLHEAATPGPWGRLHDDDKGHPCACGQIWSEQELLFCPASNDDDEKEPRVNDGRFIVAMRNALPALLDAAEERDRLKAKLAALVEACEAKDSLLVCYRLGKRPSEALFKRLEKADKAIAAAKVQP